MTIEPSFDGIETAFAATVAKWDDGVLSKQQFHDAVLPLLCQDADGQWWRVDGSTGDWLRWHGRTWVKRTRPATRAQAPAPQDHEKETTDAPVSAPHVQPSPSPAAAAPAAEAPAPEAPPPQEAVASHSLPHPQPPPIEPEPVAAPLPDPAPLPAPVPTKEPPPPVEPTPVSAPSTPAPVSALEADAEDVGAETVLAVTASPEFWSLVGVEGPVLHQAFLLQGEMVVGRSENVAISLPDARASRQHAVLCTTPEGLQIRDLGSKNGTRVNGERLTSPLWLALGDRVQLGACTFEVRSDVATANGPTLQMPVPPGEEQ